MVKTISINGVNDQLVIPISLTTDRSQMLSLGDIKLDCHRVSCSVSQGSVPWPVLGHVAFVVYTVDVAILFDRHKVNHHLYADDQQIYLHTEAGLASTRLTSLFACLSDLPYWCAFRRLQLTAVKTELICLTRDQLFVVLR